MCADSRDDLASWFFIEGIALSRELAREASPVVRARLEGRLAAHVCAARHVCGAPMGAELIQAVRATTPELSLAMS